MNNKKDSLPSQRQLQVGEQIKRILAEMLLQDDHFGGHNAYITISKADVSPDVKNAKIFVNVFAQKDAKVDTKKIIERLNGLAGYWRGKLAHRIKLRFTPELVFILDDAGSEADKIEQLIHEESKKFL